MVSAYHEIAIIVLDHKLMLLGLLINHLTNIYGKMQYTYDFLHLKSQPEATINFSNKS